MGTHVALLRGINVGKAKRIAMADLRAVVASVGCTDVRTLLNSGNVVFAATKADGLAARIQKTVASKLGVTARVTVISADDLAVVVRECPLLDVATDPSRLLVAFLADAADRPKLVALAREDWTPEAMAVGSRAAYLWMPDGVIASRVAKALDKSLGDGATSRYWTTVTKLAAMRQGTVPEAGTPEAGTPPRRGQSPKLRPCANPPPSPPAATLPKCPTTSSPSPRSPPPSPS